MNVNSADNRASNALSWLLFILNPFASLCVSLTNYKSGAAKNIIWAGCIFYGLMFNILPRQFSDCVRYAEELKQMHLTQMSWELLSSTFYKEGQTRFDIYQPTITLFVSRFTDDYRILFAIFGIGIGYFYSRTIWFFVERLPRSPALINFLFAIGSAFILDPGSAINGVRMYTAFYVFAFAALNFLEKQRLHYLVLAGASVLVHFSFVYPFLLLLAVPVAERLPGLTLTAFTISFILPSLENTFIADLLGFLPGFQQRVSNYLIDPAARKEEAGWLISLSIRGSILFVLLSAYLLPPALRVQKNRALLRTAILATLIYTGVNVFWNVYSFSRFASLSLLLYCGLWSTTPPQASLLRFPFQFFGFAVLLPLVPVVAIGLRMFLGFVSIGILLGNPLIFTWFSDADQSAYDFLLAKFRPW